VSAINHGLGHGKTPSQRQMLYTTVCAYSQGRAGAPRPSARVDDHRKMIKKETINDPC
jgi:hypothetical protein